MFWHLLYARLSLNVTVLLAPQSNKMPFLPFATAFLPFVLSCGWQYVLVEEVSSREKAATFFDHGHFLKSVHQVTGLVLLDQCSTRINAHKGKNQKYSNSDQKSAHPRISAHNFSEKTLFLKKKPIFFRFFGFQLVLILSLIHI